jgi:hypothetical protein
MKGLARAIKGFAPIALVGMPARRHASLSRHPRSDGVGHVADQLGDRGEPLPSRISTSIIQAVIQ